MRIRELTLSMQPAARSMALTTVLLAGTALVSMPEAKAQGVLHDFPEIAYFGGMSDNGSVFAGTFIDGDTSRHEAVVGRFGSDDYAVTGLGTLGGFNSIAQDVSGDGSTVVGEAQNSGGNYRAFRVSAAGGALQDLGTLTPLINSHSFGLGVSDDGNRVVGYSTQLGRAHGFVWIEGAEGGVTGNEQMFQLNELAGGYGRSEANAISGDGRYAVGMSDADATTSRAVRWDLSALATGGDDVVLNLGSLAGMNGWSVANGVSRDGRAVVGTADDIDSVFRAFVWREGSDGGVEGNPQMHAIETLGGNNNWGNGISQNGRWVVGESSVGDEASPTAAFRWSEATGTESIADWLADNGVDVGHLHPQIGRHISDDGSIVGGEMLVEGMGRIFIARVLSQDPGGGPDPEPGIMDVEEYQRTLVANAAVASTGEFLTWLPLNGAHHRPLLAQPQLGGDHCAWATGDIAHHNGAETTLGLAEIGACTDALGNGVRVGAGVGASHSWQELANGGNARLGGQYVMGEIDWQPEGTPLLFSLIGVAGHWGVDVRRGYTNGADIDYSVGETEMSGGALRARVDWLDAATFGGTSIDPFASVALGRTHLDGYTETGGAFPARFEDQDNTMREVRLGVTAVTELTQALTLSTTLEAVHRSGDSPRVEGSVPGVFGFDLGGGELSRNWVRAGAEIDYRVGDNAVISASFNAATAGRDATFSGSLGLRGEF